MASKETVVRNSAVVPTSGSGSTANGSTIYIGDLDPATVVLQAAGNASATLQYQTSIDGVNWVQCGASLVETTTFSDQTNMSTAGSNPRSAAVWTRIHCSAFSSITSLTFVVAGVPKSL